MSKQERYVIYTPPAFHNKPQAMVRLIKKIEDKMFGDVVYDVEDMLTGQRFRALEETLDLTEVFNEMGVLVWMSK